VPGNWWPASSYPPVCYKSIVGVAIAANASRARTFPSAEFVATETEVAFWNAPELTAKVIPALKPEVTRANLKLASPRLRLIKAETEVAPGVTTINTAGHTPGHVSVHIGSGSEELLLAGDVVVNSAVSCGAQLVLDAESPVTAFTAKDNMKA